MSNVMFPLFLKAFFLSDLKYNTIIEKNKKKTMNNDQIVLEFGMSEKGC
jgi:hypothetical protein